MDFYLARGWWHHICYRWNARSLWVFILAKFFFRQLKLIFEQISKIENYFNNNDLELMMLIRIIPVVIFLYKILFAGLGAKNKKFFFTTLLGLAPWSFIFGSIGQG